MLLSIKLRLLGRGTITNQMRVLAELCFWIEFLKIQKLEQKNIEKIQAEKNDRRLDYSFVTFRITNS